MKSEIHKYVNINNIIESQNLWQNVKNLLVKLFPYKHFDKNDESFVQKNKMMSHINSRLIQVVKDFFLLSGKRI